MHGSIVRVTVLAFARLREIFGFSRRDVDLPAGATLEALWLQLATHVPQASGLRSSTRFARNGALADGSVSLHDGDEIALMPPVGGG